MSPELTYIRFLQVVVTINTGVFLYSFTLALQGRINRHRKLNLIALTTTLSAVAGLILTLAFGFDYRPLTTPKRMTVHRCFSTPLAIALPITAYFGLAGKRKVHKIAAAVTALLWVGTLVTGIWFF